MDEDRKTRSGWGPIGCAMAIVIVPLLYVLASGPVYRLTAYIDQEHPVLRAYHAPLGLACRTCPPFRETMCTYAEFWINTGVPLVVTPLPPTFLESE